MLKIEPFGNGTTLESAEIPRFRFQTSTVIYNFFRTSRKALKKEIGEIEDEKEQASAELGFMFEAPDEESNDDDDEEGHSGVSDEVGL